MLNAVFAIVIAGLFVDFPGSVMPIWLQIPIAMSVGYIIYRRGGELFWPSIGALIALYVLIWLGQYVPISLPASTLGLPPAAMWVLILFIYAGVASLLPVWLLLQPRDYVNSHQLFVGLTILYLGVLIGNPTIAAPAINPDPSGAPWLIPFLFVTIACGAISGFHGLVASGTSSKQLKKEPDARFVGYFGSVGEGALALGAVLCVTAGIAATQGEWAGTYYTDWAAASGNATSYFVQGLAAFANNLGIPVAAGAGVRLGGGYQLRRYDDGHGGCVYSAMSSPKLAICMGLASCAALPSPPASPSYAACSWPSAHKGRAAASVRAA